MIPFFIQRRAEMPDGVLAAGKEAQLAPAVEVAQREMREGDMLGRRLLQQALAQRARARDERRLVELKSAPVGLGVRVARRTLCYRTVVWPSKPPIGWLRTRITRPSLLGSASFSATPP